MLSLALSVTFGVLHAFPYVLSPTDNYPRLAKRFTYSLHLLSPADLRGANRHIRPAPGVVIDIPYPSHRIISHTVRRGDTLIRLSNRYKIRLKSLNQWLGKKPLQIGRVIYLPMSSAYLRELATIQQKKHPTRTQSTLDPMSARISRNSLSPASITYPSRSSRALSDISYSDVSYGLDSLLELSEGRSTNSSIHSSSIRSGIEPPIAYTPPSRQASDNGNSARPAFQQTSTLATHPLTTHPEGAHQGIQSEVVVDLKKNIDPKNINLNARSVNSVNNQTVKQIAIASGLRFMAPTSAQVLQHYGMRKSILFPATLYHSRWRQTVHSIERGEVVFIGKIRGVGTSVIIAHPGDFFSLYGTNELHAGVKVGVGQQVHRGEIIASQPSSSEKKSDQQTVRQTVKQMVKQTVRPASFATFLQSLKDNLLQGDREDKPKLDSKDSSYLYFALYFRGVPIDGRQVGL